MQLLSSIRARYRFSIFFRPECKNVQNRVSYCYFNLCLSYPALVRRIFSTRSHHHLR